MLSGVGAQSGRVPQLSEKQISGSCSLAQAGWGGGGRWLPGEVFLAGLTTLLCLLSSTPADNLHSKVAAAPPRSPLQLRRHAARYEQHRAACVPPAPLRRVKGRSLWPWVKSAWQKPPHAGEWPGEAGAISLAHGSPPSSGPSLAPSGDLAQWCFLHRQPLAAGIWQPQVARDGL